MMKHDVRNLMIAGTLGLLVLSGCGKQAAQETGGGASTEHAPGGAEANSPAPQVPNATPEEVYDGVFNVAVGGGPVDSSVTRDSPSHSYVFAASALCSTQVSVSTNSKDNVLEASLKDAAAESTMETAKVGTKPATFELPRGAQNLLSSNLFQVEVSFDPAQAGSGAEAQEFTIVVEEVCDEDSLPLAESGAAPTMQNPKTFTTDSKLWSMQYPDGWAVEVGPRSSVNLANDAAVLEGIKQDDFVIQAGQIGLTILFIPTDSAVDINLGGANTVQRAAYLGALAQPHSEGSLVTIGAAVFVRHTGKPLLGVIPNSYGDVFEGETVVWNISDDTIGVAVLMTPPGASAAVQSTIYAIIESVKLRAPVEDVLPSLTQESK